MKKSLNDAHLTPNSTPIESSDKKLEVDFSTCANLSNSLKNSSETHRLFIKGVESYRKQEYTEALEIFSSISESNPKKWDNWFYKGLTHLSLNNFQAALDCIEQSILINENYARTWFQKGMILFKFKNFEEAQKCFLRTIALNPSLTDSKIKLINCYLKLNQFQKAIQTCEDLLQTNQKNAFVWYLKGYAHDELHELYQSKLCFRKCLEIDHNHVNSLFNIGVIFSKQGQFMESEKYFKRVIEIKPSFFRVYNDLGYLYNKQNKLDLALEYFDKSIEYSIDQSDAWTGRAIILRKKEDYEGSLQSLNQAHTLYKKFLKAYLAKAEVYRRIREFKLAEENIKKYEIIFRKKKNQNSYKFNEEKKYFICYKNIFNISKHLFSKYSVYNGLKLTNSKQVFERLIFMEIYPNFNLKINQMVDLIEMKIEYKFVKTEIINFSKILKHLKLNYYLSLEFWQSYNDYKIFFVNRFLNLINYNKDISQFKYLNYMFCFTDIIPNCMHILNSLTENEKFQMIISMQSDLKKLANEHFRMLFYLVLNEDLKLVSKFEFNFSQISEFFQHSYEDGFSINPKISVQEMFVYNDEGDIIFNKIMIDFQSLTDLVLKHSSF